MDLTSPKAKGRAYRLCRNYTEQVVCNWAVPSGDASPFCLSCRLTRVIPDLASPGNKEAWAKLEFAKQRLVYSLLALNLPVVGKQERPESGLAFELLADPATPGSPKVLTGHDDGLITLNIAEADDVERERLRHKMGEPYRTLLGHFRHEIGHYYWDRLVKDSSRLDACRALFGDDREDYAQALGRHYRDGAPPDWQGRFISAYASTHPWEDWAETWAHYLHMTDALETAGDCGMSLTPERPGEPAFEPPGRGLLAFDEMIGNWHAITYVLNNLNRGMGLADGYPFVLSAPVIEKLRFVHQVVVAQSSAFDGG